MKITGTRSYIEVEIEGKIIKIKGELLIGAFVADKRTVEKWEYPFEEEKIDDITKQKIIDLIVKKTQKSHLIITFE